MNMKNYIEEEKEHDNTFKPLELPNTSAHHPKQTLKEARLSVYSKMGVCHRERRIGKKGLSVEETNSLALDIPKGEKLINHYYLGQGNLIESSVSTVHPIPLSMPSKLHFDCNNESKYAKSTVDFINQCNQYYNDKNNLNQPNHSYKPCQSGHNSILPMGEKSFSTDPYQLTTSISSNESSLALSFSFTMINSIPNSFCYHKSKKWFAFIADNHIIIEDLSIEFNRKQQFLTHSQEHLSCVKLSPDNKILYAYSKLQIVSNSNKIISNPFVLFYAYKPEFETKFALINKCILNQSELISCEMSSRNNLSVILSKWKGGGSIISLLDFYRNEILVTTGMSETYKALKWNSYLANLEFSTISDDLLTFWRVNATDGALQYQHGGIQFDKYFNQSNVIISFEFIPPINSNVLLLLGDSIGVVYGVDTRFNSLVMKWDLFIYNTSKAIQFIYANASVIAFAVDNELKYFTVTYKSITKASDLFSSKNEGIISASGTSLMVDSEIVSIDYDASSSNGSVALTKNGLLYYIDFEEGCTVKLFHFFVKRHRILQVALMKKVYDKYTLASPSTTVNPYTCLGGAEEEARDQSLHDNYFLITSHEGGLIKIWSLPEYTLLYNFETVNEDILCFSNAVNDLIFAVSYSNTTVRFFSNEKLLGKFTAKHLSAYASFNYIRFLPESQYVFLVDTSNALYLIHVERYEPLLVEFNQVIKVEHSIVDFQLSLVEYYNKFLFNLQNVFICVYNRKFTNILKNLPYESSVPQFYLQDKFNVAEYFKEKRSASAMKAMSERYTISFSSNSIEKSYIYVLSKGTRQLIIRNFETHVIENIVAFTESIDTFALLPNFKSFVFLYAKTVQVASTQSVLHSQQKTAGSFMPLDPSSSENQSKPLPAYPQHYSIIPSDNSRLALVYSPFFIFVYKL